MGSWRHELSENLWVKGTLRLEYAKSGFENQNHLPVEKKNTSDRSVPDVSDKNLDGV